jgi:hypothetical protein
LDADYWGYDCSEFYRQMVAEKVRSYESTAEKALDERLTNCMQTKAVNPKSEVSRTTTPIGSTPLLKLEFSEWLYPLGQ